MQKVITIGTFDIPHYGHVRLLRRCEQLGELVVGLNTDEFIEGYKGSKPVFCYAQRERSIREFGFNCEVLPNSQDSGSILPLLNYVQPSFIVIGTDWLRRDYLAQIGVSVEQLEELDISLVYVPYTQEISTTEIKKRCLAQSSHT